MARKQRRMGTEAHIRMNSIQHPKKTEVERGGGGGFREREGRREGAEADLCGVALRYRMS